MRMKRMLGAAAVALLTVAAPASAATSATDRQAALGDVPATLDATIPTTGIDFGAMTLGSAGNESGVQTISVSSNQLWGATIAGDHTNMTKWDGTSYDEAVSLVNPFEWKSTTPAASSYASISTDPTPGNLLSGQPTTGATPAEVGVQFRQVTSYADSVLSGGDRYRIQVTYNIAQGL
jgi:hypothetical protein